VTSVAIGPVGQLDPRLLEHRRELTGYCYRMLGSSFDAEDAVQETMVRAWRGLADFEGRSALRSWLYRIATNVCVDMLRGPQRRARPMDLVGPQSVDTPFVTSLPEHTWVQPIHDDRVLPADGDPGDLAVQRDTIRLAFVAALQHLPPKQRSVLILREVLRWQAAEVAELLDTTVASVNSALQRARATLAELDPEALDPTPFDAEQEALLARYVTAFERYDITSLVALLKDDVTFSMPPHPFWLQGAEDVGRWMLGQGAGCRGSRLVPTRANGCTAFGSYHQVEPTLHLPFAIHLMEITGGRITAIHNYLDPSLFAAFGLPDRFEDIVPGAG
jgi:RNA polymerase sigma-70 factor (ECF subfamily)